MDNHQNTLAGKVKEKDYQRCDRDPYSSCYRLSKGDVSEERKCSYERYRILVQNESTAGGCLGGQVGTVITIIMNVAFTKYWCI